MVVRCVQKFLELSVRNRVLIHIEGPYLHLVFVKASGRILPRILHIDFNVIRPFNLDASNLEDERGARDFDHTFRRARCRLGWRYFNELLRNWFPYIIEARERLLSHLLHALHQILQVRVRLSIGCENGPEAMCFDRERQYVPAFFVIGFELDSVIEIEVANARLGRHGDLPPSDVIFVAIHNSPDGLVAHRPAAREDAIEDHGIERLPSWTHEKRRNTTLDSCHAARCFAVARCDAIPNAPDILPTLPAHSVEECKLQIVGL